MKKFGDKIRLLREEKGYSQEAVAAQIGLSVSGYGKIERDQTELTVLKAFEISKVLEVTIYKILDISETNTQEIKANDGICVYSNQGQLFNFSKEMMTEIIDTKNDTIKELKSQLKLKDDLITTLMKKLK
jgi:transcriptional regulator with XRE-family HTH domain